MTVVGRVRRGYAVLAMLILLTAGLYVARYLVVDRPNYRLVAAGRPKPRSRPVAAFYRGSMLNGGGLTVSRT
jgi:hypothetical protein